MLVSVDRGGWEPDLKVVTLPCTAIRRHGCELIGNGDVNLASMNFIKHAEIVHPAPSLQ